MFTTPLGSDVVVILSVAEGDDKPLKYPAIFFKAELLVLNKTDLLPYVSFDIKKARAYALQVHPGMEIVEVSCKTGAGLDEWMKWLELGRMAAKAVARASRPLSRERPAPIKDRRQDARTTAGETPALHRRSPGQA